MLSWAAWHCTVKRRRLGARKTFCFAALKRELKTLNTSSTSNQTSSLKPIPPKIRFPLQDSRAVEKNPKMVGVHFSQGWWLTKSFASGARKCKSGRMMKMSFVEQGTEHFCKPHLTLNNCSIYPRKTHTQISAAIFNLLNLLHHEWRQALSLSFFQGLPKKLAKPTEKNYAIWTAPGWNIIYVILAYCKGKYLTVAAKNASRLLPVLAQNICKLHRVTAILRFSLRFFINQSLNKDGVKKHSNMVDNNKEIIIKKRPFLSPWKGQTARKFYLCLYMALFYVFKYFPSDGSSRFSYFF